MSFILLLIFTGARKGELAKARWEDWYGDYIELKDHKTDKDGKTRKIWLNSQSRSVIQALQGEKKKKTILGIKNPIKLWNSVKLTCGCNDLVLHDLRHSFAQFQQILQKYKLCRPESLWYKSLSMMQRYQHIEDRTSKET